MITTNHSARFDRSGGSGVTGRRRTPRRAIGVLLAGLLVLAACTPPAPTHPCDTPIECGQGRQYSSAGSGDKVLIVGDSILGLYPTQPANTGAIFAAARVAQNGLNVRAYTSVGSMFEHWSKGLILNSGTNQAGSITGQNVASLNAGQTPPTKHVVLALGTNDATRVTQNIRTGQQVTDQVLASMNQALFTSTGCLIMVKPAVHYGSSINQNIVLVRNIIDLVATYKNNELGRTRVVVADFQKLWTDNGSPANWFQGATNPHLTNAGFGHYLDLIAWYTALAKNGSLGC